MKMEKINFKIFVSCLLFVSYFNLETANAQETMSAIAKSTAGSGRSAVEAPDNFFLNPAMQVHLRGRHFYIGHGQADQSRETSVLLSDNTPEAFLPAALAYLQREIEVVQGFVTESDLGISVAEFGGANWSMGLTARMIQSQIQNSPVSYKQTTADVGFSYIPNEKMGFGLVFYNVYQADNVPESLLRKSSIGAGMTYLLNQKTRYRLDLVTGKDSDLAEGRIEAGFESFLNDWIVFRFGLAQGFQGEDSNLLAGGLGFHGPRFRINYAYQKSQIQEKEAVHGIDFIVPF